MKIFYENVKFFLFF